MDEKPDDNPYSAPHGAVGSIRNGSVIAVFSWLLPPVGAVIGFLNYDQITEAVPAIGFDFRITYAVVGFGAGLIAGLIVDSVLRRLLHNPPPKS